MSDHDLLSTLEREIGTPPAPGLTDTALAERVRSRVRRRTAVRTAAASVVGVAAVVLAIGYGGNLAGDHGDTGVDPAGSTGSAAPDSEPSGAPEVDRLPEGMVVAPRDVEVIALPFGDQVAKIDVTTHEVTPPPGWAIVESRPLMQGSGGANGVALRVSDLEQEMFIAVATVDGQTGTMVGDPAEVTWDQFLRQAASTGGTE